MSSTNGNNGNGHKKTRKPGAGRKFEPDAKCHRPENKIYKPTGVLRAVFRERFAHNRIATKQEIDETLTLMMRGQYDEFPNLAGLQPKSMLMGQLKAIELLMKRFGMFQLPSPNEEAQMAHFDRLKNAALEMVMAGWTPEDGAPTDQQVMFYLLKLDPNLAPEHAAQIVSELQFYAD